MSSTSLLFSTKKRNFWRRGRNRKEGLEKRLALPHFLPLLGVPYALATQSGCPPTLLKSQSFQKRTSSSWWNWIFLVELGR